jgi:PAS domain-containing protein
MRMPDMTVSDIARLVPMALILSLAVLWLLGRPRPPARRAQVEPGSRDMAFLFRNGALVDHDARTLPLPVPPDESSDWARFRRWMGFRFGDLPPDAGDMPVGDSLCLRAEDGATLTLTRQSDSLRAELRDAAPMDAVARHAAAQERHDLLSRAVAAEHAPMPVWIMDATGAVIWQNDSAGQVAPAHVQHLTAQPDTPTELGDTSCTRLVLAGDTGQPDHSYELHVTRTAHGRIHHAQDITRLIRAETMQRDFVQTLSKTFADLTTGLVVFDRAMTLAVFNPALTDLTGLPPEFLSARPSLFGFFDALRDRMVMPEPKNYASWRSQIADMVKSATGGLYHEVWTLPSGQTYRVTGRPHPDGAVAFLFEDISLEVSTTRRHRLQMDLRQSVIDRLEEGIAVLARDGRLLFCNTAFGALLGIDPDSSFADMGLHDVIAACATRYPDPGLWPEVEDRIATRRLVATLFDRAGSPAQAGADLRVVPLGRGQSMLCLKDRTIAETDRVDLPAR